ncbi:MAG: hypothetical protein WC506_00760 [Candidatus Micrarchaeia archaeon]
MASKTQRKKAEPRAGEDEEPEMPENSEGEGYVEDFISKLSNGLTLQRGIKVFFSIAGIAASVLGILVTLIAYFYLSSAIGSAKLATINELSHAYDALGSAQAAIISANSALAIAPDALESTASSLDHYSNASASISSSLHSLSGSLAGLSAFGLDNSIPGGLSQASQELTASAGDMSNASSSLRKMGKGMQMASSGLSELSANLDSAKQGLSSASSEVSGAFDGIQLGILLLCMALCLFFAVFILYSIPTAI